MPLEDVVALSDEGEASQPEAAASDDAAALADELITKGKPASKPKQKAKAKATPKKVTTTKKDEAKPGGAGGAGKVLKKPSVKRPASSTSSTKPPTRAYKSMYKNGVWGIKYGGPEVIRVKPHEGVPPEKLEEIAAWAPEEARIQLGNQMSIKDVQEQMKTEYVKQNQPAKLDDADAQPDDEPSHFGDEGEGEEEEKVEEDEMCD
ncbi:hypothetical protein AK812_SmicGene572 [Symbiodinium microadriaticum]|uniref:Uncharacterized protein n=1 Tax=Symbiodinium microadriaticum TaxID=2951 RepID=A0A1Q9F6B0_SYMMI|nr:hypothetical protein AK812_SmicGene572 [Symbiodinium microadriaticum]